MKKYFSVYYSAKVVVRERRHLWFRPEALFSLTPVVKSVVRWLPNVSRPRTPDASPITVTGETATPRADDTLTRELFAKVYAIAICLRGKRAEGFGLFLTSAADIIHVLKLLDVEVYKNAANIKNTILLQSVINTNIKKKKNYIRLL